MKPMRAFFVLFGALVPALLAGCGHRVVLAPAPASGAELAAPINGFDSAPSILTGFELAPTPQDWQIGDKVLLGIRLHKPSAVTTRFLLVELLESVDAEHPVALWTTRRHGRGLNISSPVALTSLVLFDEQGREMQQATGRFPSALLGYGMFDGALPIVGLADQAAQEMAVDLLDDREYDHAVRGWLTLMSFSGSVNKRGLLRPLLSEVIARPSLLAMLMKPSVSIGTAGQIKRGAPWSPGEDAEVGVETLELPLLCSIADKPSARADVLAARPVAPLSLCGGVIGASGHNADDPRISFEIRLLAAKRGTGGQSFREGPAPRE